jgi:exosortase
MASENIAAEPSTGQVGRPSADDTLLSPKPWQITVIVLAVTILYVPVLHKLIVDWWTLPDFSHGFFVIPFSGYLLWRRRTKLAAMPKRMSASGLPIVAFGTIVLLAGSLGSELFLSRFSLIIMAFGLIITLAGRRFARAVWFPVAFLLLMIPMPAILFTQITFPLQLLASKLAAKALPLLAVPVLREGNVIQLPAMPIEVAEACSGIRSLMSLGTLAIIYGSLVEEAPPMRIALALFSVPVAVVANAARIVGTGLLVQYWDPNKAMGFFHEFSGWVTFIFAFAALFAVHKVVRLLLATEWGKDR